MRLAAWSDYDIIVYRGGLFCDINCIIIVDIETADEQVAELVLENKQEFNVLVDRYAKKIQRYVARLTGNWQESEDITQEVFFKAYVNIASFDPRLKFSSWLYRIAHNESVNFIKKNYRVKNVELNDNLDYGDSEGKDILQKIDSKFSSQAVISALYQLNTRDREIIELVYFEEKSYLEVSDILKMPLNSVGPTLNRAKGKLRKVIENEAKIGREN